MTRGHDLIGKPWTNTPPHTFPIHLEAASCKETPRHAIDEVTFPNSQPDSPLQHGQWLEAPGNSNSPKEVEPKGKTGSCRLGRQREDSQLPVEKWFY